LKPTLVYLFEKPPTETVTIWPEFSDVHMMDLTETLRDYDEHGMPVLSVAEHIVVSVPEGSMGALKILKDEAYENYVLCVSVRPTPGVGTHWINSLAEILSPKGILVAKHDRHDICEVMALREFRAGIIALDRCAELLRSTGIDASSEAMKSEKAVTKAIETLRATGCRAPRKR
jgi:hypothetical protein